jgi:putative endonuclease
VNTASPGARGLHAERHAEHFLTAKGLKLVARNFRCKMGEIDLIMLEGETLVFVEVRLRNNQRFGDGATTITYSKQRRLSRAALFYLQKTHSMNRPCRFDVMSASESFERDSFEFDWIRNAFETR